MSEKDSKRQRITRASDNISSMYFSTSVSLILTELTGVVAILIDGIVASRLLGSDAYSGISLLGPFSSIVLLIAGIFSTGCSIVCAQLVGQGEKDEANEAFNLCSLITTLLSIVVIIACIAIPSVVLQLCGVPLDKYPELNPHMYGYLDGYTIGLPAFMLVQIIGPILVMDNGKKLFTASSIALCVVDIVCDLLNVFVFRGGTFGMGLATSLSYWVQAIMLIAHFVRPNHYFRFSLKHLSLHQLATVLSNGTPALVKKLATTLRDILINYFNIMVALTTAAIAARGIQSDFMQVFFCIPTGLGRALVTMVGVYFSSNDLKGLRFLYSYALRLGVVLSLVVTAVILVCAPLLTGIYTSEVEVAELATFSIRWSAASLMCYTCVSLLLHYMQGIGKTSTANTISLFERFVLPVISAYALGAVFGSKGILASAPVGEILLFAIIAVVSCTSHKGIPREITDVMALPSDFGGEEADNLYGTIHTTDDVVVECERTYRFCMDHQVEERLSKFMVLFVEEVATNIVESAERKNDLARINFRLFMDGTRICFSMMDLGDHFDPTLFYELHAKDDPTKNIGTRIVMSMAEEVRYYNAFGSNNLVVYVN